MGNFGLKSQEKSIDAPFLVIFDKNCELSQHFESKMVIFGFKSQLSTKQYFLKATKIPENSGKFINAPFLVENGLKDLSHF